MVWKIRLTVLGLAMLLVAGAVTLLMNFHAFSLRDEDYAYCEAAQFVDAESGQTIMGAEDIVVDVAGERVIISAYDRFQVQEDLDAGGDVGGLGMLYSIPMDTLVAGGAIAATPLSFPDFDTSNFRPHGIDLLQTGPDTMTLLAVNRRYRMDDDGEATLQPVVERFNLSGNSAAHTGRFRNSALCGPNDVAIVDEGRFFVTNDHGTCEPGRQFFEELLGQEMAFVMYYDGARFHRVAEDIGYANGIALSNDGYTLFVAATREDVVRTYTITGTGEGSAPILLAQHRIAVPGAPDNLTFDDRGDLWVAYFPNIYRFAAYRGGWFGVDTAPAAAGVLPRVIGEDATVATAYEGSGEFMSGSTAAVRVDDTLVILSGFDNRVVLCEGA